MLPPNTDLASFEIPSFGDDKRLTVKFLKTLERVSHAVNRKLGRGSQWYFDFYYDIDPYSPIVVEFTPAVFRGEALVVRLIEVVRDSVEETGQVLPFTEVDRLVEWLFGRI